MLKEKFAKKMLEEKLDFLPLNESYELFNSDEKVQAKFSWIYNNEETGDVCLTMGNSLDEVKEEMSNINDGYYNFDIGEYNTFDEFTVIVCPAPTYMDLIR